MSNGLYEKIFFDKYSDFCLFVGLILDRYWKILRFQLLCNQIQQLFNKFTQSCNINRFDL